MRLAAADSDVGRRERQTSRGKENARQKSAREEIGLAIEEIS